VAIGKYLLSKESRHDHPVWEKTEDGKTQRVEYTCAVGPGKAPDPEHCADRRTGVHDAPEGAEKPKSWWLTKDVAMGGARPLAPHAVMSSSACTALHCSSARRGPKPCRLAGGGYPCLNGGNETLPTACKGFAGSGSCHIKTCDDGL
jgi:hypothetical protein